MTLPAAQSTPRVQGVPTKDGGMDAARDLVNFEGADQRSDKLLQVYKRDPSLLSQDDKVELAAYLQVYAFERLDAVRKVDAQNGLGISHSLATVQASVASLLSGEQALGYGYPYAGSSQDKLAWADAQRSQMGLVENLAWTRDRSVDEQTYLDAKSSLRIGEQQQGLANLGDPAIYFLTGSIGSTIRAVAATNGALQFTQGAKQAVDGDGWNAAGNMVAGLLGMATLGIPAIKGGAGPVVVADSKVAGGAKDSGSSGFSGGKPTIADDRYSPNVVTERSSLNRDYYGRENAADEFSAGLPDYATHSTAKSYQSTAPRDLNEQTLWNRVVENPSAGRDTKLAGDKDFPRSEGWRKMEVSHRLPSGENITIHYQYNSVTDKAYDMKITTPQQLPPVLQPGRTIE
ncbi:hypothetical protein VA602_23525 [Pseudomonas sp. MH2]|uniref:S-type Pyocin n=1 Tax=Pseudomonas machongensis TaxID=3110229 RepID=A0ABU5VLP1_9PSED|nr:hypothetical protein [Pseudomonas sp. MH2]MEA5674293.1 hypothetical protein [Pseudomonas sp. MH2]